MARARTYRSVLELVRETSGSSEFADGLERKLAERRIIKELMIRRAGYGLSQRDVAHRFGCTQSRISKLEAATDRELTLGELAKYAQAIGLHLRITLQPSDSDVTDQVITFVVHGGDGAFSKEEPLRTRTARRLERTPGGKSARRRPS
jgi:transcriptional regulator with XRE-family HTH domain